MTLVAVGMLWSQGQMPNGAVVCNVPITLQILNLSVDSSSVSDDSDLLYFHGWDQMCMLLIVHKDCTSVIVIPSFSALVFKSRNSTCQSESNVCSAVHVVECSLIFL